MRIRPSLKLQTRGGARVFELDVSQRGTGKKWQVVQCVKGYNAREK